MSATATTPLRASSLRDCPRKAVFEATGAPARDRTAREERTLYRGKTIGRDYLVMLASTNRMPVHVDSGPDYWVPPELRADNAASARIIAEKTIHWEYGVGHADALIVETGTVIEILSSAHASEQMIQSKLLQCVLYMEHCDQAESGALVIVSPTDLTEEVYPIAKTSTRYGELVQEMRDRIAQVQAWHADPDALPARVCGRPADARSHFCLHAEHCFQGWEPPAPDLVLESDEARTAAAETYRAKQAERAAKELYDGAVTQRKEHEQRLASVIELAQLGGSPRKVQIGALAVNRIEVADRESLALKKARTAGAWTAAHDEAFRDFLTFGGGHVRFQVDRVGDQPIEDFGAEAPWTAADLDPRSEDQ